MDKLKIFFAVLLKLHFCIIVSARGRMVDPPHRGSMWRKGFPVPANYNDMSLNCGGIPQQWKVNKGKCGLCGDPYDDKVREHEFGGKYALGIISSTYKEASMIDVTIELTANKMGWFEFRVCASNEPNKTLQAECFEKNLLKLAEGQQESKKENSDVRFYVPDKNMTTFTIKLTLPEKLVCDFCVLQFKYHAGNNYGTSQDGVSCLGCGIEQEEIYNCADVKIEEDASLKTTARTEAPLNTTTKVEAGVKSSENASDKVRAGYVMALAIGFLYVATQMQ